MDKQRTQVDNIKVIDINMKIKSQECSQGCSTFSVQTLSKISLDTKSPFSILNIVQFSLFIHSLHRKNLFQMALMRNYQICKSFSEKRYAKPAIKKMVSIKKKLFYLFLIARTRGMGNTTCIFVLNTNEYMTRFHDGFERLKLG